MRKIIECEHCGADCDNPLCYDCAMIELGYKKCVECGHYFEPGILNAEQNMCRECYNEQNGII